MSTDANSPTPNSATPAPTTPIPPKNPARGSQQGQTTLAAKIDRWEGMINNLLPFLEEVPQLKPAHAQLQQTVAVAKVLRDHLRNVKADSQASTAQRKGVMSTGEELFSRLALGLRSAFGPKSERLAAFTLKPLRTGRPSTLPELTVPSPTVELSESPNPGTPKE